MYNHFSKINQSKIQPLQDLHIFSKQITWSGLWLSLAEISWFEVEILCLTPYIYKNSKLNMFTIQGFIIVKSMVRFVEYFHMPLAWKKWLPPPPPTHTHYGLTVCCWWGDMWVGKVKIQKEQNYIIWYQYQHQVIHSCFRQDEEKNVSKYIWVKST